jgi:hypothetical protein
MVPRSTVAQKMDHKYAQRLDGARRSKGSDVQSD